MIKEPKYSIGDRVSKPSIIPDELDKNGTIIRVYTSKASNLGEQYNLYDIKWDTFDSVSIGHLESTLRKIE